MRILILFFVLFGGVIAYAQDISGGTDWKTEEDFKKAEKNVVENILWLEQNPNLDNDTKNKDIYAYILKWGTDCPYIKVEIGGKYFTDILNSDYKYKALIDVAYIYGKILYAIQNPENDEAGAAERGIIGMVNTYNSIIAKAGDKAKFDLLEKYKELAANGKLKDYIAKNSKKDEEKD